MKVSQAKLWAVEVLKANQIENSPREAELLLAFCLQQRVEEFLLAGDEKLSPAQFARLKKLIAKRADHYPYFYLTGKKQFLNWEFLLSPGVLIPRPETEILVQAACSWLKKQKLSAPRILDLGCGSGVIIISLLLLNPEALGWGTDIARRALRVAGKNAAALGVSNRLVLKCSDKFKKLKKEEKFNLLVCNPPYVEAGNPRVSPEIFFEPPEALFSGPTGLDFIRELIAKAPEFLAPGAALFLEAGKGQGEKVKGRLKKANFSRIESFKDLSGIERVFCGTIS